MKKKIACLFGLALCLSLTACSKANVEEDTEKEIESQVDSSEEDIEAETETETETEETELADPAMDTLSAMTLEEKVYQMFFITPEKLTGVETVTAAGDTTKECIEAYPVGGIIYFSKNLIDREQTMTMIENTQSYSKIPLFIGVDEEGGLVSRAGSNPDMGITTFSSMYSIGQTGDTDEAYNVGYTLGTELGEVGFNLDFAPVADVWSNPENQVIGSRAFGTDFSETAEMVAACVKGFCDSGTICTIKHFPGHGNTLTDSHVGAASTDKSLEEMKEEEFLPFESGIQAGSEVVMMGHILTPSITDDTTPASLSEDMVSILREYLGFDGLIITDALEMSAVSDYYTSAEAAVKAILAGDDILLMPADFTAAVEGVLEAVENGTITEERINESVYRILSAKYKYGIIKE